MLQLKNYSLKIKGKTLLSQVNVVFETSKINHLLGKNGVGKSQFAKDILLNRNNSFSKEISENTNILSSFSNIPVDLTVGEFYKILKKTL